MLLRPGFRHGHCLAVLESKTSELQLVNLKGGCCSTLKISDQKSCGIVAIDNRVFAVTPKEVLEIHSDGEIVVLKKLKDVDQYSQVVSLKKKIFVMQPGESSMLLFDPITSSIDSERPRCKLGDGFFACSDDECIYAMGGTGTPAQAVKFCHREKSWVKLAPMLSPRCWGAAAALDGKIFVLGGIDKSCMRLQSAELYDPTTNSWTLLARMHVGRFQFSSCVVNDRLYAVGGGKSDECSIEVYSQRENEWKVDRWNGLANSDSETFSCLWPHGFLSSAAEENEATYKNPITLVNNDQFSECEGSSTPQLSTKEDCRDTATNLPPNHPPLSSVSTTLPPIEEDSGLCTQFQLDTSLTQVTPTASKQTQPAKDATQQSQPEVVQAPFDENASWSPDTESTQPSMLSNNKDYRPHRRSGYEKPRAKSVSECSFDITKMPVPKPRRIKSQHARGTKTKSDEAKAFQRKAVLEVKKKIGAEKTGIEMDECEVRIPQGALEKETDVTVSLLEDKSETEGSHNVTPKLKFDPPVEFRKSIWVRLRTCISAFTGKILRALLLARNDPDDEWEELEELVMGEKNEVNFEVTRCSEFKVVSKTSEGQLHLISDLHFNPHAMKIVATFSKDRPSHDEMEKDLMSRCFDNFAIVPHDFIGNLGSTVSLKMHCQHPTESEISDSVYPSSDFVLDQNYLLKGKHAVYFELFMPMDYCGHIKMYYECTLDGAKDHTLPLDCKWPPENFHEDTSNDKNVIQNFFTVSDRGSVKIDGMDCTSGEVSRVKIQAPVGQLAAGNAKITEQGSGNTYVAGSQEKTDKSITAGNVNYGESTITSSGETIQVTRK